MLTDEDGESDVVGSVDGLVEMEGFSDTDGYQLKQRKHMLMESNVHDKYTSISS